MTQNADNQVEKTEVAGNSVKDSTVTQDDKQNLIPQPRFNEYVAKSNAKIDKLTEENNQYKEKEEVARKKQLEADGKQSELIAELGAENKELREYKTNAENEQKEKHAKLLETLPEDQRAIYSGLSLYALEEHTKIHQGVGLKVNTDTRQSNRRGNGEYGGYDSHAEWATKDPASYKKENMSPESRGIKTGYGN